MGAKKIMDETIKIKRKVSLTGRDYNESWREGAHDDIVLVVPMAV